MKSRSVNSAGKVPTSCEPAVIKTKCYDAGEGCEKTLEVKQYAAI